MDDKPGRKSSLAYFFVAGIVCRYPASVVI